MNIQEFGILNNIKIRKKNLERIGFSWISKKWNEFFFLNKKRLSSFSQLNIEVKCTWKVEIVIFSNSNTFSTTFKFFYLLYKLYEDINKMCLDISWHINGGNYYRIDN